VSPGLALDVFGDDEQRLAGLDDGLEDGDQRLKRRELLLVDEDVDGLPTARPTTSAQPDANPARPRKDPK
jgi:hypothetical protein